MTIPNIDFKPQNTVSLDIEIIELDSIYQRIPVFSHDPAKPHRDKFYCLIYITQGEGKHFIDFNHYPFQAGNFILINEGQVHAFDLESRPQGQVILFTEAFLNTTHTNIRMPFCAPNHFVTSYCPVLTCGLARKESCEALLYEINKEQQNSSPDNLLMQLLFASLLLIVLQEQPSGYANHLSEKQTKKFTQFFTLIEENHTTIREASVYAEMLNTSYKSLNRICKLAVNQTAKQLIDAHTILEAKRNLVIEGIQVQTLAYKFGFEEVSNFIKYFKKHTLATPSKFRENFKG